MGKSVGHSAGLVEIDLRKPEISAFVKLPQRVRCTTMRWTSIPGLEYLSPDWIVGTLGTVGVLAVLFVETGLLVGLVLPGDSLLFLAGVAASGAADVALGVQLPISVLLIGAPVATFLGSQLGYLIGKKLGPRIFNRPGSKYLNQQRVTQTEQWLIKYGVGKALFLSRFIPVVRTLINPMCGVAGIDGRKFALANFLSASVWGAGFVFLGFLVGEKIQGSAERVLLPITIVIIVLSTIPVIREFLVHRKNK
jgi:membrane-associated protein